jgi:hypothetical protein
MMDIESLQEMFVSALEIDFRGYSPQENSKRVLFVVIDQSLFFFKIDSLKEVVGEDILIEYVVLI